MIVPPLCIIQARYASKRLAGKMLLTLWGETLIARAWRIACEAFGEANVVVAVSAQGEGISHLLTELRLIGAQTFVWDGPEDDVLGRFYHCAHTHRWHPDSAIVRYTPDDWRKDPQAMQRVAAGQRLPVEQGGEAFTLAQLDAAQQAERYIAGDPRDMTMRQLLDVNAAKNPRREHITHALFSVPAPTAPDDGLPWSIDTQADYENVKAAFA